MVQWARAARDRRVVFDAGSAFTVNGAPAPGARLGFAGLTEDELGRAVKSLVAAASFVRSRSRSGVGPHKPEPQSARESYGEFVRSVQQMRCTRPSHRGVASPRADRDSDAISDGTSRRDLDTVIAAAATSRSDTPVRVLTRRISSWSSWRSPPPAPCAGPHRT